jgi:hypothetical protein
MALWGVYEGGATVTGTTDSERWVFRLGGLAAIVGSLAGMVGNLIHPATPLDDPPGVARAIADSNAWTAIHLIIIAGIILMLGGLLALHRSIQGGLAGALARFGWAAAIAGIAVGTVLVVLDGVTAKHLADEWAAAPAQERAAALRVVLANESSNFALAALFNILFAGVTFILYGLAVALSDAYPRWLGWVAVAAGLGSVGAGLIQALVGEPTNASRILTIIGPTVITLWLLIMGVLLVRKARTLRNSVTPQRS